MILSKDRDPRLITIRRGGTLTDDDHRLLALWDRHRVRRKLLRTLMSRNGGNFIKLSHRNAGDNAN